jgi:hypothetical protein
VLDGTWRPGDVWGGLKSGMFRLAPFTNMTPEEVAEATRVRDALAAGTLHPFDGPIVRQDGTSVIPAGQRLTDDQIRAHELLLSRHRGDDAELIGARRLLHGHRPAQAGLFRWGRGTCGSKSRRAPCSTTNDLSF